MTDNAFIRHSLVEDVSVTLTPSNLVQVSRVIFASDCDVCATSIVLCIAMGAINYGNGAIMLNKRKLAKELNHPLELIEGAMATLTMIGAFYYSDAGYKSFDRLCMNPRLARTGPEERWKLLMRCSPQLRDRPLILVD